MNQGLVKPVCEAIRLSYDPPVEGLKKAKEVRLEVSPCGKHLLPKEVYRATDEDLFRLVRQMVWDKLQNLFDLEVVRHVEKIKIVVASVDASVATIFSKVAAMIADIFRVSGTCGNVELTTPVPVTRFTPSVPVPA